MQVDGLDVKLPELSNSLHTGAEEVEDFLTRKLRHASPLEACATRVTHGHA